MSNIVRKEGRNIVRKDGKKEGRKQRKVDMSERMTSDCHDDVRENMMTSD